MFSVRFGSGSLMASLYSCIIFAVNHRYEGGIVASIYGGVFDIANTREINWENLKCLALFYEKILAFDGYFLGRGNLFNELRSSLEGERIRWSDRLPMLLSNGIIVPLTRTGGSLSDVWFNGKEYGFSPDQYQAESKNAGDIVFSELDRRYIGGEICWPDDMRDATTFEFASKLLEELSDERFANLRERLRYAAPEKFNSSKEDINRSIDLYDNILEFTKENASNTKYRRGLIEDKIAKLIGLERFSYPVIIKSEKLSPIYAMASAILKTTAGVYHAYHSTKFKSSATIGFDHVDSFAYREYKVKSDREIIDEIVFDIVPEIDFIKLSFSDIIAIRERSAFSECAKQLDILESSKSLEAMLSFVEHVKNRYIPEILAIAPHARAVNQVSSNITYEISKAQTLLGTSIAANIILSGGLNSILTISGIDMMAAAEELKKNHVFIDTMLINSIARFEYFKQKLQLSETKFLNKKRRMSAIDKIIEEHTYRLNEIYSQKHNIG